MSQHEVDPHSAAGLAKRSDSEATKATTASSPRWLMWRKFVRHRAAVFAGAVVVLLYIVATFAEFFAPLSPWTRSVAYPLAPPQVARFIDDEGRLYLRPFVYGLTRSVDSATFTTHYEENRDVRLPIYFLVRGDLYRLWGILESDLHLFGVADRDAPFFLFGTDGQARDLLSRVLFGARVSLSVGLIGVALSLLLGILLGGLSGYFGGLLDNIIQRLITARLVYQAGPDQLCQRLKRFFGS